MRFLIIGGGSIGKRHIKNLQLLGYSDIYCLRRKKDADFEKEMRVSVIVSVAELDSVKIDAVFVCTPTALHAEGIEIAIQLEAGVFMEKPLIHNFEGFEKIKAIFQGNNKVFFIGFMLRYHPLVSKIKSIIDLNILGSIYAARFEFGSYLPFWHPWEDYKTSYASKKELGGGVVNTVTHELDLIQYLFGTPASVYCEARNLNKLDIDVEEVAESVFSYKDKIVSLHLDYLQKDYDRNISILFDDGKISWNFNENKLQVKKNKEEVEEYELSEQFDVNDLYVDELKDFLRLIEDSRLEHPLDFDHAISNTNLMLLMHESALKGKKVNV